MNVADSHVFHGSGWQNPYRVAEYGKGIYLYDSEGKCYLDAIAGTHVVSIGHGVEEVADAVAAQLRKLSFVNKGQFTTAAQEELAEVVTALAPAGMDRVTFPTGGSIANEMALLIAQMYHKERGKPGKVKMISRWHSYHGRTLATAAMSGSAAIRQSIAPYDLGFPHIQAPHCYQCPFHLTFPGCQLACADDLARTLEQEGPDSIAAFIAEPIVGGSGSGITPPPGYYERIREICDEYDILFISEEVITGFGRTGKNFGIDHWNTIPDIITSTKALSSGYAPIGAIIVHGRIWDTFVNGKRKMVPAFTTYSGHPASCAAALAVQKYIARHQLIDRSARMGSYLMTQLCKLAEREPLIGDVRGKGLMIGVEFVQDRATHKPFPRKHQLIETIVKTGLENGLILRGRPGTGVGIDGDHTLLSPPFVISEEQCDELVQRFESTLTQVKQRLKLSV
ncbi:MAG: aminotransferase class III-fold pyridoxal phosphate-dependent enzyme [Chloroflexi bacterium]|nr:aminotransferase class III-fold pyridoxal phosphate-dependent enzyme [Chloroflexota bacterium]